MDWNRLKRTVAPAKPVTLQEAKDHLRVIHASEDTLINSLIDRAAAEIEGPHGRTGILLGTQTWEYYLDRFPPVTLELPLGPVQSVSEIAYTDTDGVSQTVASFQSDTVRNPARVLPDFGESWPTTREVVNAVKVTFVGGHATIPEDLKGAVLLLVGHLYANREATMVGVGAVELPVGLDRVLDRHRVGRAA